MLKSATPQNFFGVKLLPSPHLSTRAALSTAWQTKVRPTSFHSRSAVRGEVCKTSARHSIVEINSQPSQKTPGNLNKLASRNWNRNVHSETKTVVSNKFRRAQ